MKMDLVVAGYIFNGDKVLLVHHKKLDLWLPVGGHINQDETPNDALLREIKEETGLDIEILGSNGVPLIGNATKNLTAPFHVNVHPAKDHEHCCFFYACRALDADKLSLNGELKNFGWFSKKELDKEFVPLDVKHIALKAFEIMENKTNL
ncbi:MAG TPA: NUDIX domain-containing protein [Candidatus Nanoarchaeia archaeon]|nr:NUDIX domain-containing protein [Candidatus Nanoarchaeia archaeon]